MNRRRRLVHITAVVAVALAAGHLARKTILAETPSGTPAPMVAEGGAKADGPSDRPSHVEPVAAVLPATSRAATPPAGILPAYVSPDFATPGFATADPASDPTGPDSTGPGQPATDTAATTPPGAGTALRAAALPTTPGGNEPTLAALSPAVEPPPFAAGTAPPTVVETTDCTPGLHLSAAPRAMIKIELTVPCAADGRVVIRHAGLAVAETLDGDGRLLLDLPALDPRGEVSVLLPGAQELHAAFAIPAVTRLRRLGVQWIADDAFQLHGMEGGAAYGDPGDVNSANPVSPSGGYLVALGDPSSSLPMMAEVYTWPAGVTVRPVIEARVTDATCGRELMGETLVTDHGAVTTTDLTLAMPGCDAVGDILVLNNLIGESKLALTED